MYLQLEKEIHDACVSAKPFSVSKLTPQAEFDEFVKLHSLASRLFEMQKSNKVPYLYGNSTKDSYNLEPNALENFEVWLQKKGCKFPKLTLKPSEGKGLGVFAKDNIQTEELIASVPKICIMTANDADDRLKRLFSTDPLLSTVPSLSLALTLISELLKGVESKWCEYIKILPRKFSIPLVFEPEDVVDLKGSIIFGDVIRDLKSNLRHYIYLSRVLQKNKFKSIPAKNFSYDLFRWSVCVVMTRQNPLPIISPNVAENADDSELNPVRRPTSELALIPLYDMFNHTPTHGEVSTFYNPESSVSETYAPADFAAASEILVTYGKRGNSDLFLYSGFVDVDWLQYDRFTFRLSIPDVIVKEGKELSPIEKLNIKRKELLQNVGVLSNGHFELYHPPLTRSQPLLIFCRVVVMQAEELDELLSSSIESAIENLQNNVLDPAIMKKALEWLAVRCELMIRTIKVDSIETGRNYETQQVLKLRMVEKKLLQVVLDEIKNIK
ncbi:hypothetical protein HK098_006982 [Nowakowskiella sp. JEL0407]|nr:hypothetical protein HK098_006982 [Nowakowskiella sp. JEL0407]